MKSRSIFHPGTAHYTPGALRLSREVSKYCATIFKKMHAKGYPEIEIRDLVHSAFWHALVMEGALASIDKAKSVDQPTHIAYCEIPAIPAWFMDLVTRHGVNGYQIMSEDGNFLHVGAGIGDEGEEYAILDTESLLQDLMMEIAHLPAGGYEITAITTHLPADDTLSGSALDLSEDNIKYRFCNFFKVLEGPQL